MEILASIWNVTQYWLVYHPHIHQFEWKKTHTFGASPLFLSLAISSYLSAIAILRFLKPPSPLRPTLLRFISALHSLTLLVLSLIMAVGCSLSAFSQMSHPQWLFCFPPNNTPPRGPVFFWAYVFYLSKLLELGDTFLILLGGNSIRRLSFLHVYHHAVVLPMSYLWLEGSQSLMPIALVTNTGVHVLMYGYYLACAVTGRQPRWKRAVTDVQMGQFVFSFAASGVMLWFEWREGCSGMYAWCFNAAFNASLLALFRRFHSTNYRKPSHKTP